MSAAAAASYGLHAHLEERFDTTVVRVKEALKSQGFGVLTEIDVRKTLKEKTGLEMEPYLILGACNPQLASRAISAEHEIGLLLPCNVLIHSCDGRVTVAAQDPTLMLDVTGNELLRPIAEEARARIQTALDSLAR